MAGNYLIKVSPEIDKSDGRKMERDLNTRFSRVSKKFGTSMSKIGSRLKGVLAGAGVALAGLVATAPYDELEQSMNETLKRYDFITSRAKQLGVSSGELVEATTIAESTGLEDEDFKSILAAFAVKLGEARAGEDPMLREFMNEENLLDAFFQMIKSLQKLEPSQAMMYTSKIIGEDDAIKLAKLINTDIEQRRKELFGSTGTDALSSQVERLSSLETQRALQASQREISNLNQRSKIINEGALKTQNEVQLVRQWNENKNLQEIGNLGDMQLVQEATKIAVDEVRRNLVPVMQETNEKLAKTSEWLQRIAKRMFTKGGF